MLMQQSERVLTHEISKSFAAQKITFADHAHIGVTTSIATEVPVRLTYGGMPYAVMMATPADLEDFAYGFSLTEGIIRQADEIRAVEVESRVGHIELRISLAAAQFQAHLARRRQMTGRTACGICGIEQVEDLTLARAQDGPPQRLALEVVERAMHDLDQHQALNHLTQSVHAAAWYDRQGHLVGLREDVGRHNALDKIIGHLLRQSVASSSGFFLLTSRASFEMIEKAALFGARTVVAISAPTSLAIERAQALGVGLIAVARHDAVMQFYPLTDHKKELDPHA